MLPLSANLLFDIGTVSTVWYFNGLHCTTFNSMIDMNINYNTIFCVLDT